MVNPSPLIFIFHSFLLLPLSGPKITISFLVFSYSSSFSLSFPHFTASTKNFLPFHLFGHHHVHPFLSISLLLSLLSFYLTCILSFLFLIPLPFPSHPSFLIPTPYPHPCSSSLSPSQTFTYSTNLLLLPPIFLPTLKYFLLSHPSPSFPSLLPFPFPFICSPSLPPSDPIPTFPFLSPSLPSFTSFHSLPSQSPILSLSLFSPILT